MEWRLRPFPPSPSLHAVDASWHQRQCVERIGLAATGLLAFEAYAGAVEFVTGDYLINYSVRTATLAYGFEHGEAVGVRATGTFIHADEYAVLGAALALLLLRYWQKRSRAQLALLCAALGFGVCALSGLRGVLLPYAVIAVWIYIGPGPHHTRRAFGWSAAIAVSGLIANALLHITSNEALNGRLRDSDNIYARIASFESSL